MMANEMTRDASDMQTTNVVTRNRSRDTDQDADDGVPQFQPASPALLQPNAPDQTANDHRDDGRRLSADEHPATLPSCSTSPMAPSQDTRNAQQQSSVSAGDDQGPHAVSTDTAWHTSPPNQGLVPSHDAHSADVVDSVAQLEPYDWDDLLLSRRTRMHELSQQETQLMNEFNALCQVRPLPNRPSRGVADFEKVFRGVGCRRCAEGG